MNAIVYLIPVSLGLAAAALAAFFWTVKRNQYDDPEGDRHRIFGVEDKPLPPVREDQSQ